jgi:cyclopropane fatty-acyl-phospholipid synthase-like methyltransferase
MTLLDRLLQRWRIAKVAPIVRSGARVLDVGCGDTALFDALPQDCQYLGIDPELDITPRSPRMRLVKGEFPRDVPPGERHDVITALAAFEHVPDDAQAGFICACNDALEEGGLVVLTIPHPRVDDILHVLQTLRLVDWGEIHQHHGYDVNQTSALFERHGFALARRSQFQLGLNNVFVFEKRSPRDRGDA